MTHRPRQEPRPAARSRAWVGVVAALVACVALASGGCAKPNQRVYRFEKSGPDPAQREAAREARERALSLIDGGRPEQAFPLLTEATRLNPRDGVAFNNLGWLHQTAGRPYAAAVHYRRAAELRPGDPVPLSNLGLVLGEAGQWERAADLQRQAVALAPTDPRFRSRFTYARIRRGDGPEQLRAALEAVVASMRDASWVRWAADQLARTEPATDPTPPRVVQPESTPAPNPPAPEQNGTG